MSERATTSAVRWQLVSKAAFGENGSQEFWLEHSTSDWTKVANEKHIPTRCQQPFSWDKCS